MLKSRMFAPLRRNLFEPLDALRSGTTQLRYWKELERTQYLTESELKRIQWNRLKELLEYVWVNNDFYKNRFLAASVDPSMVNTQDDFARIPILTKDEIRGNTGAMISREFDIASLLQFKTGGSTGKSLEIYMTEECSELRNACARRHDCWTGWQPGEPIGAVWGNPYLPKDIKSKLRDWCISPFIYLDTMSVSKNSILRFAEEWEQVKPTLLYGHAHSIFVLAEFVRDIGITSIRPRGILSTSMMLMPHERRTIESVFGIKVTDRYGCEEVSLIASECGKHEGMHLNIEHLYIEFLRDDGTCAAPGEPGRIVVTDLMNRAMPFIRYLVEDIGVQSEKKCSCGRGLPLMDHVSGRVADFLLKNDGSRVAGVSLIENTLTKYPGIVQMQIIQKTIETIILNMVVDKDYESEAEIIAYFKEIFSANVDISLNYIDKINPEPNGKYRFSVSNIC